MGLFDDDFYSTKVTKRSISRTNRSSKWRGSGQKSRYSVLKISIISSVLTVIVVVLLFNFMSGTPFFPNKSGNGPLASNTTGDPFERISQAALKVKPTVVSILNHGEFTEGEPDPDMAILGSGVIFKKENDKAYIITNAHVIYGAQELEVVTSDGVSKEATIIGQDQMNDIAVLEIDATGIDSTIHIGDSKSLKLGETVIAVGNPLGLGGTSTFGIISYTSRMIPISLNQDGVYDWEQEVIQTDAAINDGNSGGALVDLRGQLIGINTMKISDTGVEGLGFAIPVNEVMKTVDDIMEHGKVIRPYLGVYTLDLNNPYSPLSEEQRKTLKLPKNVTEGVIVLEAHGPAKEAGFKLNDIITELDKHPIDSTRQLRKYLYENKKIGDTMEVTYYRNGEPATVQLKLTDKPSQAEIDDLQEDNG
jgi:serine protease Do